MRRAPLFLICVAAMLPWSPGAAAQDAPPDSPPDTSPDAPRAEPATDAAPIRERIARRLAELDAERERLRDAMRDIDAGRAPAEGLGTGERGPMWERWRSRAGDGGPRSDQPGLRTEPPPQPSADELTEEQLDRAQAFVVELVPEVSIGLDELRQADPRMFERMRRALAPRALGVIAAIERDPELGALQREEFRAGIVMMTRLRQLRDAHQAGGPDSPEFTAARAALRAALAEQFDAKLALRQLEFSRMLARIEEVREELRASREGRDAHLDRAVAQAVTRLQHADGPRRPPTGDTPAEPRGKPDEPRDNRDTPGGPPRSRN